MAKILKITQVRSSIGRMKQQKMTLKALGFKRRGQTVEQRDIPEIRGMVKSIQHLVSVEEIDGE